MTGQAAVERSDGRAPAGAMTQTDPSPWPPGAALPASAVEGAADGAIDGAEVFRRALKNRARTYPGADDARLAADRLILPAVTPGFRIPAGSGVFTIGSCFARNVEDALVDRGLVVPTVAFSAPGEEAKGRSNRILNQYNPGTMLQCVAGGVPPDAALFPAADGLVTDPLLSTGGRPVTRDRALQRRDEIARLYADGLADCATVVVTLGLVEAWFDRDHSLWLNETPPHRLLRSDPGRFEFRRLGVDACRALVFDLMARLTEGRRRNVILTVSPVPLQVTFAGGDAVTANAYSKAVLRVVAELAAGAFDGVDYFPSYEIVTTLGRPAFMGDNVHVRQAVVDRVIGHMTEAYSPGA